MDEETLNIPVSDYPDWLERPLESTTQSQKKYFIHTYDPSMGKFSGWTNKKCTTCARIITKAQLSYSLRFYKKILCGSCQGLEQYKNKGVSQNGK